MITEVNDLETVAPILKEYFHGYIVNNDPFEKIAIYNHNGIMGIVSYSIMYERAEINYIITLPHFRNKGIGSKLLEYALKDINNKKCKNISLEVEAENEEAINLYLKYGFKKEAVRPKYYNGKDAYLMTKEIEVK